MHTYEIGLNMETGAGYKADRSGVTTESDTAALLRSACLSIDAYRPGSLRLWIEWIYQVGEDACEEDAVYKTRLQPQQGGALEQ